MLELNNGADILAEVGRICTLEQAWALFTAKCDADGLQKLSAISNQEALLKIANAIAMTEPDAVFVNSGSEADVQVVREMSLAKGEESPLAMPGHTIHFDLAQEQARIVDRTFYIVNPGEHTSVLELAQAIMLLFNKKISLDVKDASGQPFLGLPAVSIEGLKRDFGAAPRPLEAGLRSYRESLATEDGG